MHQSRVEYLNTLPSADHIAKSLGFNPETVLLIYDRRLKKKLSKWLKLFPYRYAVKAGEDLKSLNDFPKHVKKIIDLLKNSAPRKKTCFVGIGGGSVGDFTGFLASVYKRGVFLIHIPSTYLAAIDSAHGGKTALNIKRYKNQIGTFYSAHTVFIVQSLLEGLPKKQTRSAMGELCKMALIDGDKFFSQLSSEKNQDRIWDYLPLAIEAKNKIVEQDPFEAKGIREILNLGHTLGHCLEMQLQLSHGEAVGYGTRFALEWSHHCGYLDLEDLALSLELLKKHLNLPQKQNIFTKSNLRKLVVQDKKLIDKDHIQFVFLEKIGKPFVKAVSLDSFLTECERQNWIKG